MLQKSLFDGRDGYEPGRDDDRLTHQLEVVRRLMEDGRWRTLQQLRFLTGFPEASISARLRDLRKVRFGSRTVERNHKLHGLFVYRLAPKGDEVPF